MGVALALALRLHAQDSRSAPLAVGVAIDGDLSAGQSHTYQLSANAGDFIRLTVEQKGVDIVARILRPDGRELLDVDAISDEFRPETIVAVADLSGDYAIHIRSSPSAGAGGRYAVRLDELRPSEPSDDTRIEAARVFESGRKHYLSATPAYRDALAEFSRAVELYRTVSDRRGEMDAELQIAQTRFEMALPDGIISAERAEWLSRELRDEHARAAALRAIGRARERTGDMTAALNALEESAALSRALGNDRSESASLNSAGVVYGRTGHAEQAIASFERALLLSPTGRVTFSILTNLGIAYRDLGEYDRSLRAYERALTAIRALENREAEALILNNIGNLERSLGHTQRALELHLRALVISRELGARENEARSLNTIGQTYYALGDYARALDYHQQAMTIRRTLQDLPGQAASLDGVGRALNRLGRSEEALGPLREALTIRQNIRERYGEASTLRNLATAERDRGNLAAALRHAEAAVDLDERSRAEITSPSLRASYVAGEQDKYELFIDLLQRQHAASPDGGHAAAALRVSERARARVLLESLLDARVDLREGIDPDLLVRERALQKQLNETSGQLSRALAVKGREEQAANAGRTLERLTADYAQLQTQIRERSPRYAAVTQPQPLDVIDIQRSVADDDTVVLEFALGEERSWLWAITPHTLTSVALPPRREIDAAARSLYERLTARQTRRGETRVAYWKRVNAADVSVASEAAAVSRMLFGGIAHQLNAQWPDKRLAIVASGALEYLPFAALPLTARHEIVTIPSASVLAVLRRDAAGRRPAPHALAILADPVFEAADPRVTPVSSRASPRAGDTATSRAIDVIDALYGRSGLSRLPFSRDEANAIAALAGDTAPLKAIDFKASRETALSGALAGHRIVHLATHGLLDAEHPSLSALVLSLVDEHGARQNGYLRLPDIYNLRLDADLVVLSACQTALGKEIKGEGLVGLTRAFFYAGAPRVVASLWQVNDLATAELMKRFYRGMLQRQLRPAAALHAAQIEMSHDPRWTPPYFWAGFVLQGEWR